MKIQFSLREFVFAIVCTGALMGLMVNDFHHRYIESDLRSENASLLIKLNNARYDGHSIIIGGSSLGTPSVGTILTGSYGTLTTPAVWNDGCSSVLVTGGGHSLTSDGNCTLIGSGRGSILTVEKDQ